MIRILELTLDINDVPVEMTANDARELRDFLIDLNLGPKETVWSVWPSTSPGIPVDSSTWWPSNTDAVATEEQ